MRQVEGLSAAGHRVWYTHCGSADPALPGGTACRVDLASGAGLAECLAAAAPLGAVINAAAVSQPALCERDPAAAAAVNVPTQLVRALADAAPSALLIHVSTDQVYDGTRPWNREGDAAGMRAVNAYGGSKRDAEALVTERWANHAVLRSSIIVGPPPRAPVGRPLFLQWLDGALAGPAPTELFEDEYRSPVCVDDLVAACAELMRRAEHGPPLQHRVFNMGGPERCEERACQIGPSVVASLPLPALTPLACSGCRVRTWAMRWLRCAATRGPTCAACRPPACRGRWRHPPTSPWTPRARKLSWDSRSRPSPRRCAAHSSSERPGKGNAAGVTKQTRERGSTLLCLPHVTRALRAAAARLISQRGASRIISAARRAIRHASANPGGDTGHGCARKGGPEPLTWGKVVSIV